MSLLSEIGSSTLLFLLIFGMSATVDICNLKKQLKNRNAIITGVILQFVLFPFLGFVVVKALGLDSAEGITLLVVTSSPGGSYSNWWCSMFNADLALSVTMTAISTLMSIIFLPVNLIIYTRSTYEADVIHSVDWVSLFIALGIVISAIGLGLYCSASVHSPKFNIFANKLGSLAGLALVVYSILISSKNGSSEETLWNREWKFYLGVASPCVLGLAAANLISTSFRLKEPERVTVSVECCYQNVGIATSVAITMFQGKELSRAVGVPLFYGLVEAVVLGIYCITAWKIGWTKAPPDESFCVVIGKSYEVKCTQIFDLNAIEVVLGSNKDRSRNGDEDVVGDDILFELDHSTVSISDSERENGSIYAISYPAPPPRKDSEKNNMENKHSQHVTRDSTNMPTKKDSNKNTFCTATKNKISQRMEQSFQNKETFARNANSNIYNHDHHEERDLELGIETAETSTNPPPSLISQNDIETSPAESSISMSVQSKSDESLSNSLNASQDSMVQIPLAPQLSLSSSIVDKMTPPIHTFQPSSISSYIAGKESNYIDSVDSGLSVERYVETSKELNTIQSCTSSSSMSESIESTNIELNRV